MLADYKMIVYVFGNGNLSFENFTQYYIPILTDLSHNKNIQFLMCDFRGADTLTMEFLKMKTSNVSIFHIGESPRYFPDRYRTKVNEWIKVPNFKSDSERDEAALNKCTHFLAKDFNSKANRLSSTYKNIQQCISYGKRDLLSQGLNFENL